MFEQRRARRARSEAQRFYQQLRRDTHAAPDRLDPAVAYEAMDRILHTIVLPDQANDPSIRAMAERTIARGTRSVDEMLTHELAKMQTNIEAGLSAQNEGVDISAYRPLIGHLKTGQLNAVTVRVPGRHGGHLVLLEDQMMAFATKLSDVVAWAIPREPAEDDMHQYFLGAPPVAERIEALPEIAERFTEIVTTYAVTGSLDRAGYVLLPPDYVTLSTSLSNSLFYFVLAHEYAHILQGHMNTTVTRKGVLPVAEADTFVYSWRQEFDADLAGMRLAINACQKYENYSLATAFMGIGLYFEGLDVMGRAVALLQTGNEEDRQQFGSHPPLHLRKERLRKSLSQFTSDVVQTALAVDNMLSEVIQLLWERTRPVLLDLRQQGVPAAYTWHPVPKEWGYVPGTESNPEDQLTFFQRIIREFSAVPESREVVALALVNLGLALGQLGRYDEELATFERVVHDYAADTTPGLRVQVAQALFHKGIALGELGRPAEKMRALEQVIRNYGDDPAPNLREVVASALFNDGTTLGDLGRPADAQAAYERVIHDYGSDPAPALRKRVAQALVNKADALGQQGLLDAKQATCERVIHDYGADSAPTLRIAVAKALFNKGNVLEDLGQFADALAIYTRVVHDYGSDSAPDLREEVAKSLYNKGYMLAELGRFTEALDTYELVIRDYGDDPTAGIRDAVARASYYVESNTRSPRGQGLEDEPEEGLSS